MALPFLDEDNVCHPETAFNERLAEIADQVEAYLIHEDGESIPGQEPVTEPPGALIELRRIERWGKLPWDGGMYDQPFHFMQELEAAMIGRHRRDVVHAINAKQESHARSSRSNKGV